MNITKIAEPKRLLVSLIAATTGFLLAYLILSPSDNSITIAGVSSLPYLSFACVIAFFLSVSTLYSASAPYCFGNSADKKLGEIKEPIKNLLLLIMIANSLLSYMFLLTSAVPHYTQKINAPIKEISEPQSIGYKTAYDRYDHMHATSHIKNIGEKEYINGEEIDPGIFVYDGNKTPSSTIAMEDMSAYAESSPSDELYNIFHKIYLRTKLVEFTTLGLCANITFCILLLLYNMFAKIHGLVRRGYGGHG